MGLALIFLIVFRGIHLNSFYYHRGIENSNQSKRIVKRIKAELFEIGRTLERALQKNQQAQDFHVACFPMVALFFSFSNKHVCIRPVSINNEQNTISFSFFQNATINQLAYLNTKSAFSYLKNEDSRSSLIS